MSIAKIGVAQVCQVQIGPSQKSAREISPAEVKLAAPAETPSTDGFGTAQNDLDMLAARH
jgi:hypothetical protein